MANVFQATARIPTRPLSYENIDEIMPKELAVDYTNGNIYVADENGVVHDLSMAVAEYVSHSEDLAETIKVVIQDEHGHDVEVILETAIATMAADLMAAQGDIAQHGTDIGKINDFLDTISDTSGDTRVASIQAGAIVDDATHRFVTDTQLQEIASKATPNGIVLTVYAAQWTGSEAPYKNDVTVSGFTAGMPRPIVDINHYDGENYDDAMDAEDAWCKIYRAVTGDNKITFYATEKPEINLSVFVKYDTTGLTGVS